jgi:hypothetical protein
VSYLSFSTYGPKASNARAAFSVFSSPLRTLPHSIHQRPRPAEIIKTLRWHLARITPTTAPYSDQTIDPELWEHLRRLIEVGDWEKVAREAAVFFETKLREWASVPFTVTGSVDVFKAAISSSAFELGKTASRVSLTAGDNWRQASRSAFEIRAVTS